MTVRGGVAEVGFLRSDGLGMAKAQGKRHSRLILGEVFLEIAFSCLCVIVLMRVFCFAKNSVSSALRCDIFPESAIIALCYFLVVSNLRTVLHFFGEFCRKKGDFYEFLRVSLQIFDAFCPVVRKGYVRKVYATRVKIKYFLHGRNDFLVPFLPVRIKQSNCL